MDIELQERRGHTSNPWCVIARIFDLDATSVERVYKHIAVIKLIFATSRAIVIVCWNVLRAFYKFYFFELPVDIVTACWNVLYAFYFFELAIIIVCWNVLRAFYVFDLVALLEFRAIGRSSINYNPS